MSAVGGGTTTTVSWQRPDILLLGRAEQENMSLAYLASACEQAGHRCELLEIASTAQTESAVERTLSQRPRAIGLSIACQAFAPDFMRLAAALREGGFDGLICAGGHFATLAAAQLLRDSPALDLIVQHEGEQTLVALLRALPDGPLPRPWAAAAELAGLLYRDHDERLVATPARPLPTLDAIHFPKRPQTQPDVIGYPIAQMIGSRGCYGSCNFCSIQSWHRSACGPRFRQRSVANIADEMAWLRRERGVRLFNFQDDTFFVPSRDQNRARLRQFAAALLERDIDDIALSVKCRPSDVDPECLDLLEGIGLVRVYAGIETTSEQGLITLGRGVSSADNERALRLLSQRKVMTEFNVLLFDPDTTLESVLPNIELLERNGHIPINFCRTVVYTGTPLEQRLRAERRLRGNYLIWGYDVIDPRVELMARIADVVFHRRNFRSQGMAHLSRDVRFELAALRHFCPQIDCSELETAAERLSRQLASSSARHLRQIHGFASDAQLDDQANIQQFAISQARQVHREDFELLTEVRSLQGQIVEHQQMQTAAYQPPTTNHELRRGAHERPS